MRSIESFIVLASSRTPSFTVWCFFGGGGSGEGGRGWGGGDRGWMGVGVCVCVCLFFLGYVCRER
jgi:hypothetical protein